ncbi:hypothetical protein BIY24_10770 [Halobacteriovorax marinus]|uniref:Uncharacterized protein n=1 Tax=Halobacteriovorax marinus (strain ATCC BAA-682 / DSM 15412 / SJ) TaxID=862908 RepID=E1X4D1_HALMS|nr:hypothetical protein [Halobacteriovorax marinus]ATH08413.1 hypothetical protein BIY24_10770 [Halobacteriovorax marinus]CBW27103.1 hypothetical protein BMS_2303 [Halobacteriovorax marinus SJ]
MKFSTEVEGIVFEIEVTATDDYKSFNPLSTYSIQDLDDLKENLIRIYAIEVSSSKNQTTLKHYTPGVLMSSNEEDIPEELEDALDEFGIIEHILKHWKLNDSNNLRPEWAKVE